MSTTQFLAAAIVTGLFVSGELNTILTTFADAAVR
jgi:hypothetical protein